MKNKNLIELFFSFSLRKAFYRESFFDLISTRKISAKYEIAMDEIAKSAANQNIMWVVTIENPPTTNRKSDDKIFSFQDFESFAESFLLSPIRILFHLRTS